MRKFSAYEVLVSFILLAAQCVKGVQYNWAKYLCQEFLTNCWEAQEESRMFHYALLLLSIILVSWKLLEDSEFTLQKEEFPKAARFALLWATKYLECIKEKLSFGFWWIWTFAWWLISSHICLPPCSRSYQPMWNSRPISIRSRSKHAETLSRNGTSCLIWWQTHIYMKLWGFELWNGVHLLLQIHLGTSIPSFRLVF